MGVVLSDIALQAFGERNRVKNAGERRGTALLGEPFGGPLHQLGFGDRGVREDDLGGDDGADEGAAALDGRPRDGGVSQQDFADLCGGRRSSRRR